MLPFSVIFYLRLITGKALTNAGLSLTFLLYILLEKTVNFFVSFHQFSSVPDLIPLR